MSERATGADRPEEGASGQSAGSAAARPRRWLRRLVIALGLVVGVPVVLAGALVGYLHTSGGQERVRSALAERASEQLDGSAEIGELSFSLLGDIEITGVRLLDPAGSPVVTLDSLEVTPVWRSLLGDETALERLAVRGLTVDIVEDEEGSNLRRLLAPALADDEPDDEPSDLDLRIDELLVEAVNVTLEKPSGSVMMVQDFGLSGSVRAAPGERTFAIELPEIGASLALRDPDGLALAVDELRTGISADIEGGRGEAGLTGLSGGLRFENDPDLDIETELGFAGFRVAIAPDALEAALEGLAIGALSLEALDIRGGSEAGALAGHQEAELVALVVDAEHLNELLGERTLRSDVTLGLGASGEPAALDLHAALRSAGGDLDLAGTLDASDPASPRYDLSLVGDTIDPQALLYADAVPAVPAVSVGELRLDVDGRGRDPAESQAEAEFFAGPIEIDDHRIDALEASVSLSDGVVTIAPLRALAYEQTARLTARVDTQSRDVSGELALSGDVGQALSALRAAGADVQARIPPGAVRAPDGALLAEVDGDLDGELRARVLADRLQAFGGTVDADVSARLRRRADPAPHEDAITLEDASGELGIRGLDLGAALASQGRDLGGMQARLSGRATVEGAPAAPRIGYRASVTAAPAGGGDTSIRAALRGHATEQRLGWELDIEGQRAGRADHLASAEADIPLAAGGAGPTIAPHEPLSLALTVPERELSELLAYAPEHIRVDQDTGEPAVPPGATISAQAEISGTGAAPQGEIDVDVVAPVIGDAPQRLSARGTIASDRSGAGAPTVAVRGDVGAWLDAAEPRALDGTATVELSRSPLLPGPREVDYAIEIDAPPRDLDELPIELAGVGGTAQGAVSIRGSSSGSPGLEADAAVSVTDLVVFGRGPLDAELTLDAGREVDLSAELRHEGTPLFVIEGSAPHSGADLVAALRAENPDEALAAQLEGAPIRARAELPRQDISAYQPISPALADLPGKLGGQIELEGDPTAPRVTGALAYDDFETASGRHGSASLQIEAAQTIAATATAGPASGAAGADSPLVISAELPRDGLADYLEARACWEEGRQRCGDAKLPITADARADRVDVRDLAPAFAMAAAPEGVRGGVRGELSWELDAQVLLDPRARAAGEARAPLSPDSRLRGTLSFDDGAMPLPGTKRRYEDVTLRVRHDERGVDIEEISLRESDRDAEARELEIRAHLGLDEFRPAEVDAELTARDWLVFGTDDFGPPDAPRGVLTADIGVRGDVSGPDRRIDVDVAELELLAPERFEAAHYPEVTHRGDVIFMDEGGEPGRLPVADVPPPPDETPAEPPPGGDEAPATSLDLRVAIAEGARIMIAPLDLFASGDIEVTARGPERDIGGGLDIEDGALTIGGAAHDYRRGNIYLDAECPDGCMDIHFGHRPSDPVLREFSRKSGGEEVEVHLGGPLSDPDTSLSGAGSPGSLFDLLSVHNTGRQRYLAAPDRPASFTAQHPQHTNLLMLTYLGVNVPHLLFFDKSAAWSDPYAGRGTESYGRIQNYEGEGYSEDGDVRVRARARPRRPGASEHELSVDYLFRNTPRAAFGVGLSAGDRLGGGPGLFFEWSSDD